MTRHKFENWSSLGKLLRIATALASVSIGSVFPAAAAPGSASNSESPFQQTAQFLRFEETGGTVSLVVKAGFHGRIILFDPDSDRSLFVEARQIGERSFLVEPDILSSSGILIERTGEPNRRGAPGGLNLLVRDSGNGKNDEMRFDMSALLDRMWGAGRMDDLSTFKLTANAASAVVVARVTRVGADGNPRTELKRWVAMLPAPEPLPSRRFDRRFGFFPENILAQDAETGRGNIIRLRLEAEMGQREPRQPIRFYLDPRIPPEYRIWVKRGVEEWVPALAAAGFDQAIEALDPPLADDWDEFSATHNIVSWSDWGNRLYRESSASGGSGAASYVIDPATGEIVRSRVILTRPVEAAKIQFFARCGGLLPGGKAAEQSVEVLGRLVQSLVAHETGHALGLMDGSYGKFAYETSKLRDPEWLTKYSFTPSVMNYSRCNSVAQSADGFPLEYLVQRVGPADIAQIAWAYGGDNHFRAFMQTLPEDAAFRNRISTFYSSNYGIPGPHDAMDAGDSLDILESSRLSLINLRIVARMLETGAASGWAQKGGELIAYRALLEAWKKLLLYAASPSGGYDIQRNPRGQLEEIPFDEKIAEQGVDFLLANAFQDYGDFDLHLSRDVTMLSEGADIIDTQIAIFDDLFSDRRLQSLGSMSCAKQNCRRVADLHVRAFNLIFADMPRVHPKKIDLEQKLMAHFVEKMGAWEREPARGMSPATLIELKSSSTGFSRMLRTRAASHDGRLRTHFLKLADMLASVSGGSAFEGLQN